MPEVAHLDRLAPDAASKMALTELETEREKRAQRMESLFEKGGANFDLTTDEATEIKSLNDELTVLAKACERNAEFQAMKTAAAAEAHRQHTPAQPLQFPGDSGPRLREAPKSLAQLFIESDAYKGYVPQLRRGPAQEVGDVSLWTGMKTLLTETGYAPQAIRIDKIVEGALRRPMVADLLPQGTTDQIAIVYMEETTTTNSAAMTSEGAAKPESALAFTERTAAVRKCATVLPVTEELLADVPAMRSYLEARLRLFLALSEETNLITGDGNAPSVLGLLNATNLQTQAKGTDPTPDAIYKAMVKIETTAFVPASGVIFHPLDWQDVRLLRTSEGMYIWGAPMDAGPERIWGLPVVSTTAMTQNTALVGAFDTCTQMFRKGGVGFAISDQNEDFFIKNKLMLRVEERFALAIYRGAGLCQVTGV